MPWKNGGGVTVEIAAHPDCADLDDFVWRVSIAEVGRDGPFSRFPGVDRTLVLLEGAGMRLAGPGIEPIEVTADAPIAFAGEAVVDCALLAGPVRDLNLMVRRATAEGAVEVIRGDARTLPAADAWVCHVAAGACEIVLDDVDTWSLAAGHSLVVTMPEATGSAGPRVVPSSTSAIAVVAMIRNRSAMSR